MTQSYLNALQELEDNPELTVEEVVRRHTSGIKWDRELKGNLRKRKKLSNLTITTSEKLCTDHSSPRIAMLTTSFTEKVSMDRIFPNSSSENRVICVPGKGSEKSVFSY